MDLFYLDPSDVFLIGMETLLVVGACIALVVALMFRARFPKLTSEGWLEICIGIILFTLHGVFDVLDTIKWSIDGMKEWLNIFDGLFFVLSIVLIGVGIWKVANYGARLWGR